MFDCSQDFFMNITQFYSSKWTWRDNSTETFKLFYSQRESSVFGDILIFLCWLSSSTLYWRRMGWFFPNQKRRGPLQDTSKRQQVWIHSQWNWNYKLQIISFILHSYVALSNAEVDLQYSGKKDRASWAKKKVSPEMFKGHNFLMLENHSFLLFIMKHLNRSNCARVFI